MLASLTYILFGDCDGCEMESDDKAMVKVLRILATASFLLGILSIALSLCCKGTPSNSLTPQVVVSQIPEADLEKSPAPVLAYNHIPHRQAFDAEDSAMSYNLTEFVANTDNIDEQGAYNSANAGFWTEEIDGPVTPPPTYEEALIMKWPVVTVKENSSQNSEETVSFNTGL